ncbi:MAG: aldo/keto reductase [Cyanobacteria bacterium P01_A01_bin.45]
MSKQTRRNFLISSVAAAGGIVGVNALQQKSTDITTAADKRKSTLSMPERVLGNTGISLPIFGLGGAGQTPLSWNDKEKDAIELVEKALQLGIRYFDTAASYGPSEDYLGKVLPSKRSEVFLVSKTAQRDRDGAWRELERSLRRLNTDYLDVWQLHHVSLSEELDTIFSNSGAIKAMEEAKEQKIIKFTGITGHHEPDIIVGGLERYDFDTTLIPVNAADKFHPRPFLPVVLPVAKEKNVGVIAMKVPAYGRLFKPGGLNGMQQAMGYSLSVDGVDCCIIAAENMDQLEENINVARNFKKLNNQELIAIEKQAENVWEDGTFFRVWT